MASIYDDFANDCAALAAKRSDKFDRVRLPQLAGQWRSVAADQQGAPGKKLPGTCANRFTPAAQRAGWEAGTARANKTAAFLAPVIAELRAAGNTTKYAIARALNTRGIRTPRGAGEWRPIQVARLLKRLAE